MIFKWNSWNWNDKIKFMGNLFFRKLQFCKIVRKLSNWFFTLVWRKKFPEWFLYYIGKGLGFLRFCSNLFYARPSIVPSGVLLEELTLLLPFKCNDYFYSSKLKGVSEKSSDFTFYRSCYLFVCQVHYWLYDIKHEYLRSRAYKCLSLSSSSSCHGYSNYCILTI